MSRLDRYPAVAEAARSGMKAGDDLGASVPVKYTSFLLIVGSFFYLNAGAQVYPVELLLAVVALHALTQPKLGLPGRLVLFLLVWLVGTLLGDWLLGSPSFDSLRGAARVTFLMLDLIALWFLTQKCLVSARLLWIAFAIGQLIALVVIPNPFFAGYPWKFGFGAPITYLAFAFASRRSLSPQIAVAITLTGVHFLLGFRSMSLICAGVGVTLFMAGRVGSGRHRPRLTSGNIRLVVLACVLIGAAIMGLREYDRLAGDGALGGELQAKANYQSGGAYGSLFSGRTETLISLRAIGDNPIIGGGSYSVASPEIVSRVAQLYQNEGYSAVAASLRSEVPEYHSQLLGSWAENGISAVPFWLAVGVVAFNRLRDQVGGRSNADAFVCFVSIFLVWNLFFSPFGADYRMTIALGLCVLYSVDSSGRKRATSRARRGIKTMA